MISNSGIDVDEEHSIHHDNNKRIAKGVLIMKKKRFSFERLALATGVAVILALAI